MLREHHPRHLRVHELLDDDRHASVSGVVRLDMRAVGVDVRGERRLPAVDDLRGNFVRTGRAEMGEELSGTARGRRVLDGGARTDGHRDVGVARLAQRPVAADEQFTRHGRHPAGGAADVLRVGGCGHHEAPRNALARAHQRAETGGLAADLRDHLVVAVLGSENGRRSGADGCHTAAALTARSSTVTTPVLPSTRIRSPVLMTCVPIPVATNAGKPYSRDTIAACDMMPPPSDTAAPIRANTIDQLGAVSGQIRISPSIRSSSSSTLIARRATPSAMPGEAASPRISSASASAFSAASQRSMVSELMPNNVTVIGSVTVSGGTPSAAGGCHFSRAK